MINENKKAEDVRNGRIEGWSFVGGTPDDLLGPA